MPENDVVILRIQVLIYDDENNYGDFKDDDKSGNKYCDFLNWSPYIPILGTIKIGHPWIWNISAAALAGLPWCC